MNRKNKVKIFKIFFAHAAIHFALGENVPYFQRFSVDFASFSSCDTKREAV